MKFLILCLALTFTACKQKPPVPETQSPAVQNPLDAPVEHIKSMADKVEQAQETQQAANQSIADKEAAAKELSNVE